MNTMVRDLSISPGRSVLWGFLVTPLLLLPAVAPYLALHRWHDNWPVSVFCLWFLAAAAGVPVHEVLHWVGWRVWGAAPRESISFGAKSLVLYVTSSKVAPVWAYRRMVALPGLLLGVLPCVAAIATANEAVLLFGLAHLGAASGDAIILWRIRRLPGAAPVRDHGSRVGCVLVADDEAARG